MNITIRDGLSIALKILGFHFIYMALTSTATIAGYLPVFLSLYKPTALDSTGIVKLALFLPSVIPFLLYVVTACILLKFSDKISAKLISVDKEIQIFGADNWQKEVFTIALRIFGAYEVAKRTATLVWQFAPEPAFQKAIEKDSWQNIAYTLVCIAIGVYLLTGAKHIVNLVFKEKKPEPLSSNPTDSTTPSAESAKSA